jgi:hypothetical protein
MYISPNESNATSPGICKVADEVKVAEDGRVMILFTPPPNNL